MATSIESSAKEGAVLVPLGPKEGPLETDHASPSWWAKRKAWLFERLRQDPEVLRAHQRMTRRHIYVAESRAMLRQASEDEPYERIKKLKAPPWIFFAGISLIAIVGAVKPSLPDYAEGSQEAFWAKVLTLLVSELGVALIVAFVIAWGIDAQAKRREMRDREVEKREERRRKIAEERDALEREQRLVQDVFRGVLGIRHSSAYVWKVIETS